jgi:hypothetical protein
MSDDQKLSYPVGLVMRLYDARQLIELVEWGRG